MAQVRFISTTKDNMNTKVADNTIKEGSLVVTTDSDELYIVDKQNNPDQAESRLIGGTNDTIRVMGTTVGNLKDGDEIPSNLSITEVLKRILQKEVAATYTAPVVGISNNGGTAPGNIEVGTSITPNVNATFTQNDAGALTEIIVLKNGTPIPGATSATAPYANTPDPFILGDETVNYAARATYSQGPEKQTNMGNPSPTGRIEAGSKTSANLSYVGKRNLFYGVGAGATPELTSNNIRGLTSKVLGGAKGSKFTQKFNVGDQYMIIAVPGDIASLAKVKYIETNDEGMSTSFTKSVVQVADARGEANGLTQYSVFVFSMAGAAQATMTFDVTI